MGRQRNRTLKPSRISIATGQRLLAYVWLGGSGLLFVLVLALTLRQRYGDRDQDVWTWLLGNIVPTVTLIIGFVVHTARTSRADQSKVSALAFWTAMVLSCVYLVLLLALLVLHPLTPFTPLELLRKSAMFLPAIQGLLGLALGVFFASKSAGDSD